MKNDLKERLLTKIKVNQETGCWEWQGGKRARGYGCIFNGNKMMQAHRMSYVVFKGDIPDGMVICHKCDNPPCINPEHLFAGTLKDNMQDCLKKGRNKCWATKIDSDTRRSWQPCGQFNHNSKLTEKDVVYIRSSTKLLRELAEMYGVSIATISKVRARIRYGNVV